MTGRPDLPENYHTITYRLAEHDGKTNLSLSQDNNGSDHEAEHSGTTWRNMLEALKRIVEPGPA
jgi:hypothetical protein